MNHRPDAARPPKNFRWRAVGVTVVLMPVALLAASLAWDQVTGPMPGAAMGLMFVAALLAALNGFLSPIRPALFAWRHGSMEGYRHASGIPVIGAMLVVFGGVLGFGHDGLAVMGLAAYLADTGGPPWILFATWNDATFWDEPAGP